MLGETLDVALMFASAGIAIALDHRAARSLDDHADAMLVRVDEVLAEDAPAASKQVDEQPVHHEPKALGPTVVLSGRRV